jgi:3',5'-cyclic AMP phosphodiesterase CpdA
LSSKFQDFFVVLRQSHHAFSPPESGTIEQIAMSVIAHISDLHFGKPSLRVREALLRELKRLKPTLIVVSGDLTQRALNRQFRRAQEFLHELPAPYLVIPGNHDVPVAFAHRLIAPLARYKYYISPQLNPVFVGKEFRIIGLNTAHSLAIEAGRITRQRMDRLSRLLSTLPKRSITIVVAHHPFIRPPGTFLIRRTVVGGRRALRTLEKLGVDVILSGHFHKHHTADLRDTFDELRHSIVHVQTGSALRKCFRGDQVGFTVVSIQENKVSITHRRWNGRAYLRGQTEILQRRKRIWF